MAHQHR